MRACIDADFLGINTVDAKVDRPLIHNRHGEPISRLITHTMHIVKWEPFKEIDRLFDDRSLFSFPQFPKLGWDLAVDVFEEKSNVIAKMSLPGVKPEELDISLEDDALTISGRREEEKETEEKDYYSKEIRRGSFSRSVSLPASVDASKAQAEYKDGMLVVTMPAIAGVKQKAVKVEIKK